MKFKTTLLICSLLVGTGDASASERKKINPAKKTESVTIVYQFNGPPPSGGKQNTTTLQHPLLIASLRRDLKQEGTKKVSYTGCLDTILIKVQRKDGTNGIYTKEGSFLVNSENKLGYHLRNATYELLTLAIEAVKESKTESRP